MSIILQFFLVVSILSQVLCNDNSFRGLNTSDKVGKGLHLTGNVLLSLPATYVFSGADAGVVNLSTQLVCVKGNNPRSVEFSMKSSQSDSGLYFMIGKNKYKLLLLTYSS